MIVIVIQSIRGILVPNLCFIVRYLIVTCHSWIAESLLEGPVYCKHIFHLYSYSLISSIHESQKRQLENLNGYSIHRNRPLKCPYKWLHVLCEKKVSYIYHKLRDVFQYARADAAWDHHAEERSSYMYHMSMGVLQYVHVRVAWDDYDEQSHSYIYHMNMDVLQYALVDVVWDYHVC